MLEFKEGKNGNIKVVDDYGEVIGKIKLYYWSGEFMFFPKKYGFTSEELRLITFKLEALNAPSNNS